MSKSKKDHRTSGGKRSGEKVISASGGVGIYAPNLLPESRIVSRGVARIYTIYYTTRTYTELSGDPKRPSAIARCSVVELQRD